MRGVALILSLVCLAGLPSQGCGNGGSAGATCHVLSRDPAPGSATPRQVTIEVRFLTVEDGFLSEIGLDLPDADPVFGPAALSQGGGRCGSGDLGVASDLIGGPDGAIFGLGDAYVPGDFLPLLLADGWPALWKQIFTFLNLPGPDHTDVDLPDREEVANNPYGFAPSFVVPEAAESGYDILSRTLGPAELDAILGAVSADPSRRDVLSAPRVTLFNDQTAFLQVAETVPLADLTPSFREGVEAVDPAPSFVVTGLTVVLRPEVSEDLETVRIQLFPESQSASVVGSTPIELNSQPAEIQVPVLAPGPVTTTVTVPDGGTILLGGIKREGQPVEEGIPTLRKIPSLQRLFRRTNAENTVNNLMLMVTPRIIIHEEE